MTVHTRSLFITALLIGSIAGPTAVVHAAKIEAIPGKKYTLKKEHGPWMVLVDSFVTTPKSEKQNRPEEPQESKSTKDAKDSKDAKEAEDPRFRSAEQVADELVLELRQKGIPAYVFYEAGTKEKIETTNRRGQKQLRIPQHTFDNICVVAGNYQSLDDDIAKKTLGFIKKYRPKCLENWGTYVATPGRSGPLGGAFMTMNPLLSTAEMDKLQNQHDPLLIKLNSGVRHSLAKNKGDYTMIVATFQGKSKTVLGKVPTAEEFLKDNDLDPAAREAEALTNVLREKKLDAYVWHDQYQSIVTIGSYSSPQDVAVTRCYQTYSMKPKTDPRSGAVSTTPELAVVANNGSQTQVFACESQPIPAGWEAQRIWAFDPEPKLIQVPRLK